MEIRPFKQYLIICKIGVTPFSAIFDKITKGVTPRNPENAQNKTENDQIADILS